MILSLNRSLPISTWKVIEKANINNQTLTDMMYWVLAFL